MTPFSPTPIPLESAANVAFGHALHDVVRAAQAFRESHGAPITIRFMALSRALDRLTALGWVPGPERVGTALAGSGEALGWRPIEAAKDRQKVLLWFPFGTTHDDDPPGEMFIGLRGYGADYETDEWDMKWRDPESLEALGDPTHWMPLPDPPGSLTGAGGGG